MGKHERNPNRGFVEPQPKHRERVARDVQDICRALGSQALPVEIAIVEPAQPVVEHGFNANGDYV